MRAVAYRVEFAVQAKKLAMLGHADLDIAKFFGVRLGALMQWKTEYPELDGMIEAGRVMADAEVVHALYERAIGYQAPATKFFMSKRRTFDDKGKLESEEPEVVSQGYVEHYPPDVGAIELWLTNRQPDKWKRKTHQELSGEVGVKGSGISALLAQARDEAVTGTAPATPEPVSEAA